MTDRLQTLVEDTVAGLGLGLDVEAVDVSLAGRRRLLRIALDADGGIGIDHVTAATRALSAALDEADAMGSAPYTLEVTSRGVDRPLTLPRHWRRNGGRLVRIVLGDDTVVEGRIGDSDDDGVTIETRKSSTRLRYQEISSALVQTELNRKDA